MGLNSSWQKTLLAWTGLANQNVADFAQRKRHFLWAWHVSLPTFLLLVSYHYFVVQQVQLAVIQFVLGACLLLPARALIADTASIIWAEFLLLAFAMSFNWLLALFAGSNAAALFWVFSFPFLSYFICSPFQAHCWNLAWFSGLVLLTQISGLVPSALPWSGYSWGQFYAAAMFYTLLIGILKQAISLSLQHARDERQQAAPSELQQAGNAAIFRDPLTGLPNRLQLQDLLQQELAAAADREQGVLVIHLRLLGMFELSSLLGPAAHDDLIRHVVRSMQASVGSRGTFSRIRRDEFICLYRNHSSQFDDLRMLRDMLNFQLAYRSDDFSIPVQHICGIAVFPLHGHEPELLLHKAEQAMLHAQFSNLDLVVYESSMELQLQRRHQLFGQLHEALIQGSLSLHYQGQVDLHTGHLIGAEALARWFDTTNGSVPPLEFIPVAEKSGLIKPFTLWVLRQGLSDLARWRKEGLDISLSVNISARSITDAELVDAVYNLLDEFKLPPRKLILELTEASFRDSPDLARQTMLALANLGVQISIDDFGSGCSSLSYLKDLPVHELKIDQSLVRGLTLDAGCRAIVQSTIQLAHNLNLRVVAEGIENPRTELQLRELGCDFGQGYWYGKAMSAEVFRQWVGNQQARANDALYG